VKQKPDGTLYVEWHVCCRRSEREQVLSSFLHAAGASDMLLAVGTRLFIAHLVFVRHNQTLMAIAGVGHMQP